VVEAASAFWEAAGLPVAFPRDLRRAIALTQPISIVLLPELQVTQVQAWLQRHGSAVDVTVGDRPLRACLVARSGRGIIFVEGRDQENEQRFSIAHELAHFLLDYLAPRREAVARLGAEILEVWDGRRPARVDERALALLTGVRTTTHVHLLGRVEEESVAEAIDFAEARADALALELLAPWADVTTRLSELGVGPERQDVVRLLADYYGLPPGPARRYAARLQPRRQVESALLRHLRGRRGTAPRPCPNAVPSSTGGRRR
jgi:hypothetical protein